MMVFRRKGKHVYETKVRDKDGRRERTFSTGTSDEQTAKQVEGCYLLYRRRRRWDVIDLILAGTIKLPDLYDWEEEGIADEGIAEAKARAQDVDLHGYVSEWNTDLVSRKHGSALRYLTQLQTLYPAAQPFTRTLFTAKEIEARIAALPVIDATRTKYRAAAANFSQWLYRKEVLTTNVIRDVRGWGASDERESYHEADDAKRVILATVERFRAASAYAYACAAEWSAIQNAEVQHFRLSDDPPQCFVPGTKNKWRRRWVPIVPELLWTVPILKAACRGKTPTAKVFAGLWEPTALVAHKAACEAVGVQVTTLHDWRHTHAVNLLKWGYDEQIVASHLGHKDTAKVRDTYGRWIPKHADYARTKKAERGIRRQK